MNYKFQTITHSLQTNVSKNNSQYIATLTATVGSVQLNKIIANCALSGSTFVCPVAYYNIISGHSASWSVSPGFDIETYNDDVCAVVTAPGPNMSGTVTAVINGDSGPITQSINFVSCDYDVYGRSTSDVPTSYVRVYPNPVSTILTIEIDEDAAAQMRAAQLNGLSVGSAPTYDIRLYNTAGLVRQTQTKGSQATIDVSALPSGFYYLHVDDGILLLPEVHKIIVN